MTDQMTDQVAAQMAKEAKVLERRFVHRGLMGGEFYVTLPLDASIALCEERFGRGIWKRLGVWMAWLTEPYGHTGFCGNLDWEDLATIDKEGREQDILLDSEKEEKAHDYS